MGEDGNAGNRDVAAVGHDRAEDDPRRPAEYQPNDAFWRKRGYARQPGMTMRLAWRKVGSDRETGNDLTFWLRRWEPA